MPFNKIAELGIQIGKMETYIEQQTERMRIMKEDTDKYRTALGDAQLELRQLKTAPGSKAAN